MSWVSLKVRCTNGGEGAIVMTERGARAVEERRGGGDLRPIVSTKYVYVRVIFSAR